MPLTLNRLDAPLDPRYQLRKKGKGVILLKKNLIGTMIKGHRHSLGLTQIQFVELCNATEPTALRICHQSNLSRYESGKNMPPADMFMKIMTLGEE